MEMERPKKNKRMFVLIKLVGVGSGRKTATGADDRKDRDDGRDTMTVETVGGTREGTGRRKAQSWRRVAEATKTRQMKIRKRQ